MLAIEDTTSAESKKRKKRQPRPVETRVKLTPPMLAERWGISREKVIAWIENNELRAVNIATTLEGKHKRWLIDIADVLAFEAARSNSPPIPAQRRRKAAPSEVVEYV
jgi:hypothetical protein